MLSRPVDYASRPWRSHLPERLSKRAAVLFGGVVSLLLWLGILAVVVKFW